MSVRPGTYISDPTVNTSNEFDISYMGFSSYLTTDNNRNYTQYTYLPVLLKYLSDISFESSHPNESDSISLYIKESVEHGGNEFEFDLISTNNSVCKTFLQYFYK